MRTLDLLTKRREGLLFPDVSIDQDYTVIVAGNNGADGVDNEGQLVVHWATQGAIWDPREDTAILMDSAGGLVDMFHHKGKRVTRPLTRSRRKAP